MEVYAETVVGVLLTSGGSLLGEVDVPEGAGMVPAVRDGDGAHPVEGRPWSRDGYLGLGGVWVKE